VGLLAVVEATRGDLRASALWMLAAMAIDSVDGTLARAGRSGCSRIDTGDSTTWSTTQLRARAGRLPGRGRLPDEPGWAALPVLASAYGFAQDDAKTDDGFFLGFLVLERDRDVRACCSRCRPPARPSWCSSVLVFVPFKYVYRAPARSSARPRCRRRRAPSPSCKPIPSAAAR
jgi:hypothetical protein